MIVACTTSTAGIGAAGFFLACAWVFTTMWRY